MIDVGGRRGVKFEEVGGVMESARKPTAACNERNDNQRRGLIESGEYGGLRRLQTEGAMDKGPGDYSSISRVYVTDTRVTPSLSASLSLSPCL